ncbi:formylglycine-generating enzyme family protein [Mesobaculum littorinae]|uniref:Formylglycine-generating enzyme family protein n=1 Tax=Mesobaculum littorinae TaxID=2486419 RepID=A0A438AHV1_9RHOB|nr:formylglycine-generating enzyme family protein [Mesobaculum littorinae]RVV98286.1 formylglycine-generating enzyme family protein [Mesobaculum littorinae]
MSASCCSPSGRTGPLPEPSAQPRAAPETRARLAAALIELKGGFFDMGARTARHPGDFDAPRRKVRVSPFRISATAVTNDDWAAFVAETGHRTIAETDGWSSVFHLLLPDPVRWPDHPPGLPWWRVVDGACWSAPEGTGSDLEGRGDHPVVHVSWFDAQAYCTWAGLRLPTEAEWEFAARGGRARTKFPWGNERTPGGRHAMNVWQGRFPTENSAEDGHVGTAPVRAFVPNDYGLWNTCGNVWEWVGDWFGRPPAPRLSRDPAGPEAGDRRVQRGGSFLCDDSYCERFYVHSRTANTPDSSTCNAGFRVAAAAA